MQPALPWRGALSAKREEVPLGCNLGEAVAFSPIAFSRFGRVLRDCHVGCASSQ